MLPKNHRLNQFGFLPIILALVALAFVACSPGGSAPEATVPEAGDESPSAATEADATAPEAGDQPSAVVTDDYQAQREACTSENPCWAEIVDLGQIGFAAESVIDAADDVGEAYGSPLSRRQRHPRGQGAGAGAVRVRWRCVACTVEVREPTDGDRAEVLRERGGGSEVRCERTNKRSLEVAGRLHACILSCISVTGLRPAMPDVRSDVRGRASSGRRPSTWSRAGRRACGTGVSASSSKCTIFCPSSRRSKTRCFRS